MWTTLIPTAIAAAIIVSVGNLASGQNPESRNLPGVELISRTTPIEGGLGATIDGRLQREVSSPMPVEHAAVSGPSRPSLRRPKWAGLDRPCARRRMEWAAGMKEGRRKCSAGAEPRKCQWIEHHAPADFPLPLPARFRVLGKRKRELDVENEPSAKSGVPIPVPACGREFGNGNAENPLGN